MDNLIVNVLLQLSTLALGILAGLFTSWLASEELQKYSRINKRLMVIAFVLTLLSPLFFVEKWIPVVFIALSWAVIAIPQKNEEQMFFMLSPLTLFLASQNKDAFFVNDFFFFIASGLATVKTCTLFVKENTLHFKKNLLREIFKQTSWFIGISALVYVGMYLYLQFI